MPQVNLGSLVIHRKEQPAARIVNPKKKPHPVPQEGRDLDTFSNLTRVAKTALNSISTTPGLPALDQHLISLFSFVGDLTSCYSTVKSITSLVSYLRSKDKHSSLELAQKRLELVASLTNIFKGTLVGVQLLDTFKILNFAKIAETFGRIPVIGKIIPFFPFSSLICIVSALKSGFDTAISGVNISLLNKGIQKIEMRKAQSNRHTEFADFAQHETTRLEMKGYALHQQALRLINLNKDVVRESNEVSAPAKICDELDRLQKKYRKISRKLIAWNRFDQSDSTILRYRREKNEKWDAKIKDNRSLILKESLSILHNVANMVALVAVVVLTALGVVTTLPALIAMSSVFLALALGGIALHFLKKCEPKPIRSIPLPTA